MKIQTIVKSLVVLLSLWSLSVPVCLAQGSPSRTRCTTGSSTLGNVRIAAEVNKETALGARALASQLGGGAFRFISAKRVSGNPVTIKSITRSRLVLIPLRSGRATLRITTQMQRCGRRSRSLIVELESSRPSVSATATPTPSLTSAPPPIQSATPTPPMTPTLMPSPSPTQTTGPTPLPTQTAAPTPSVGQPSLVSVRIKASQDSCVAPCPVFFDALDTTEVAASPLEAQVEWNFGDDDSALYRITRKRRNRATGFNAAHLYTQPGTYQVTARVRLPNGATGESSPTIIRVADPSSELASFCVSTNSDFSGCPVSDPSRRLIETDFSVALQRVSALGFSANRQIMFRRGQTFELNSSSPSNAGIYDRTIVRGFGPSAQERPRLHLEGDHSYLVGRYSVLMDFEIYSSAISGQFGGGQIVGTHGLLYNLYVHDIHHFAWFERAAWSNGDLKEYAFVIGNTVQNNYLNDVHADWDGIAVLDNDFGPTRAGHTSRFYGSRNVFAHNVFSTPSSQASNNWALVAMRNHSYLSVISDNFFINGWVQLSTDYAPGQNILFERNFLAGSNEAAWNGVMVATSRVAIRNCIFYDAPMGVWIQGREDITDVTVDHNTYHNFRSVAYTGHQGGVRIQPYVLRNQQNQIVSIPITDRIFIRSNIFSMPSHLGYEPWGDVLVNLSPATSALSNTNLDYNLYYFNPLASASDPTKKFCVRQSPEDFCDSPGAFLGTFGQWKSLSSTFDPHSVMAPPRFFSLSQTPEAGGILIDSGSPARSMAPRGLAYDDFTGEARSGAMTDSGALQYRPLDSTISVSGQVLVDGQPRAGLTVYVVPVGHATTDNQGRYRVDGVPRGMTYTVIPSQRWTSPVMQNPGIRFLPGVASAVTTTNNIHDFSGVTATLP